MEDTKQNDELTNISGDKEAPKNDEPLPKASISEIYKYLSGPYKMLFFIGSVSAFFGGFNFPLCTYIVQRIFDRMGGGDLDYVHGKMVDNSWFFTAIAVMSFFANFTHYVCFTMVGQKLGFELKWRYLRAILRQDTNWFESQNIEGIPSTFHKNMKEIETGLGRCVGFIIYAIGSYLCGIGITFAIGWIYLFCLFGVVAYSTVLFNYVEATLHSVQNLIDSTFVQGGIQAEETFNSIKVIKAFRQEKNCSDQFLSHLESNNSEVLGKSWSYGAAFALLETIAYHFTCYAFVIGGFFVSEDVHNSFPDEPYTGGDIFSCISFLCGNYFFCNSLRNMFFFGKGREAAYPILQLIDKVPEISLDDDTTSDINELSGDIQLNNIVFKYPGTTKNALDRISIHIKKGQTLGIIGPTGSGKSTIAKLLERFYDPTEGEVLIDGQNLKSINLRKYRHLIGYVGQEPCLFNETIRENLQNSYPGATEEDIINALKKAHAWNFVKHLEDGIDHNVGAVGSKLSGGQKQRIAIARALVRNPQLLIFDEATSALDFESERKVQEAIDSIEGDSITKVVIAHRLTTVKDAENIIVLEDGKIAEQGDHEDLMRINGIYAEMIGIQLEANRTEEALNLNEKHKDIVSSSDGNDNEQFERTESDEVALLSSHMRSRRQYVDQDESQTSEGLFSFLGHVYVYAAPKWYIPLICISATLVAVTLIVMPYPLGKFLFTALGTTSTGADVKQDMAIYLPIIFGMGILAAIFQFCTRSLLHIVNTNLLQGARKFVYNHVLRQPIEFFDHKNHNTGNLTAILSSSTRELNGAAVELYLFIFQSMASMVGGMIFAFIFEWNMGILFLFIIPVSWISMGATFALQSSSQSSYEETISKQEKMISDYIMNYHTVLSLANEDTIISRYFSRDNSQEIEYKANKADLFEALGPGFVYGFGTSFFILSFTFVGLVSAHNVKHGHEGEDQLRCTLCFWYAFLTVSYLMSNPPDFGKSLQAVKKIFGLNRYAEEGEPDCPIKNGDADLGSEGVSGAIEFHHVYFRYPSARTDKWVLQDFNLKINEGESIGLVGESGCGKSTIAALLFRFYEPQSGHITIGGRKLDEFTLSSVRAHFGYVQQEPILFNTTIMENICFGKPHATCDEIKLAAKVANCEEFIRKKDFEGQDTSENDLTDEFTNDTRYSELDDGYRAVCGSKGDRLSGGQKQRIAIARAVIDDPKFLILDEATSALDESAQKVVQESLDEIMTQRTSIVIAHRRSTLSKCKRIVTIENGIIVRDVYTNQ
ncbi:unnamed protein product [Moneuplotes crassus]|uniref:Uncharacterized protein n=1 Tax=Euplotes crassus TaxID=5936 RepID=A0AAD1U6N8_EUPCR|nr:unnamed protein product [Moneuplotes crassus]